MVPAGTVVSHECCMTMRRGVSVPSVGSKGHCDGSVAVARLPINVTCTPAAALDADSSVMSGGPLPSTSHTAEHGAIWPVAAL